MKIGGYFMLATERFLDGFLPWVVGLLGRSDHFEIGSGEVVAGAQQREAGLLGERVGEAITELQCSKASTRLAADISRVAAPSR